MQCHELACRIRERRPDLSAVEIARLCVMLFNASPDPEKLADESTLGQLWRQVAFRLEAAADQHASVVAEVESLLGDGPIAFSPEQLWTLLRAVKVQSQMLELFTDDCVLA